MREWLAWLVVHHTLGAVFLFGFYGMASKRNSWGWEMAAFGGSLLAGLTMEGMISAIFLRSWNSGIFFVFVTCISTLAVAVPRLIWQQLTATSQWTIGFLLRLTLYAVISLRLYQSLNPSRAASALCVLWLALGFLCLVVVTSKFGWKFGLVVALPLAWLSNGLFQAWALNEKIWDVLALKYFGTDVKASLVMLLLVFIELALIIPFMVRVEDPDAELDTQLRAPQDSLWP